MVCVVLWCEAHWGPGASSSAVVGDTGLKVQEHGMEGREEEEFQGDVAISGRCCRSAHLTIPPPSIQSKIKGQSGVCLVDGSDV